MKQFTANYYSIFGYEYSRHFDTLEQAESWQAGFSHGIITIEQNW